MKKLLVASLVFLMSFSALAVRLSCGYSAGQILREDGSRVARSFNPRILRNANQISLDIRNDQVSLYSIMNLNINRLGDNSCADFEVREGFDCFRIFTSQFGDREFLLHVSPAAPRKAFLVMSLGGVGGTYQNDEYRCR